MKKIKCVFKSFNVFIFTRNFENYIYLHDYALKDNFDRKPIFQMEYDLEPELLF